MEGLSGPESRTLRATYDSHIVSRHADFTKRVITPFMKRSFTRRIVLWGYQVLQGAPTLPADLGTRPIPKWETLDDRLWVAAEQNKRFRGSGARPRLLRNVMTGEICIFKNGETSNLTVPSQGIDSPSQPLRARAASLIANEVFGIGSPVVSLVEYQGVRGSLQPVIPDAVDLSELYVHQRDVYEQLVRSTEFAAQRSDLWLLERAVGNIDPQSHNILMADPRVEPGAPLILRPVDLDLTFPPVRDYKTLFGVKQYMPAKVRRESYERLRHVLSYREPVTELVAGLLTKPEIDAMFDRMVDTVAIIDNTIALRGEAATFF